jgi:hypothetical protein
MRRARDCKRGIVLRLISPPCAEVLVLTHIASIACFGDSMKIDRLQALRHGLAPVASGSRLGLPV